MKTTTSMGAEACYTAMLRCVAAARMWRERAQMAKRSPHGTVAIGYCMQWPADRCLAESRSRLASARRWHYWFVERASPFLVPYMNARRDPTRHCYREDSPTSECRSCGFPAVQHTGCDCDD